MCVKVPDQMTEVNQGSVLDSCPFCGKRVAIFARCQEMQICTEYRKCQESHYVCVVCSFSRQGCGASTGFFPSREEAAAAWNRRS